MDDNGGSKVNSSSTSLREENRLQFDWREAF